jgi:hypothetical protein
VGVNDALFDVAVGLTSLRDWLQEHPTATFTDKDVQDYWTASVGLSSFRDIANAGKHRIITRYTPTTTDAVMSAPSAPLIILETLAKAVGRGNKYPGIKIVRADGSRHRVVDLARTAITECEAFMTRYGVA